MKRCMIRCMYWRQLPDVNNDVQTGAVPHAEDKHSRPHARATILDRMKDTDHEHDEHRMPSDPALRVMALESLLVEKGLVDPQALDALVEAYEHRIGPHNGAKVVARAWTDPAYKERLLADATAAIAELGCGGLQGEHMVAVENTPA